MYSSHRYADTRHLGSRGCVHCDHWLPSVNLLVQPLCVQENDRLSLQVQGLSSQAMVSEAYRIRARHLEQSKTSATLQVRLCHHVLYCLRFMS